MTSFSIYSSITKGCDSSRALVAEAIHDINEDRDLDDRVSADSECDILREATYPETLRDYVVDTQDGIEDCNVDDSEYLLWVIETHLEL